MVSQGINIGQGSTRTDNIAIVNCLIEQSAESVARNYLPAAVAGTANHILLWHHSIIGMRTVDSYGGQTNLEVKGSMFSSLAPPEEKAQPGWSLDQNHFVRAGKAIGGNATSGDPGWVKEAEWNGREQISAGDYRPGPGSPLNGRIKALLVPVDVNGNPRRAPTAAGALAGIDESTPRVDDTRTRPQLVNPLAP